MPSTGCLYSMVPGMFSMLGGIFLFTGKNVYVCVVGQEANKNAVNQSTTHTLTILSPL